MSSLPMDKLVVQPKITIKEMAKGGLVLIYKHYSLPLKEIPDIMVFRTQYLRIFNI